MVLETVVHASTRMLCYSLAQSCLILQPRGQQHARPPCPSPSPRACSNSYPSSRWCHPTISPSVVPFSSRLPSLPASGSFAVSQLFASGGQRTGAATSVLECFYFCLIHDSNLCLCVWFALYCLVEINYTLLRLDCETTKVIDDGDIKITSGTRCLLNKTSSIRIS